MCGFTAGNLYYVMGGSQGSKFINDTVRRLKGTYNDISGMPYMWKRRY